MTAARRLLPWLALAAALGLATMPAWRVMVSPDLTVEDLLALRCTPA